MTSPFDTTVLDIDPIVEKESRRKVKCVWCAEPIERGNEFLVRKIRTDVGVIKGNFHLGCSSALNGSKIEFLKQGWSIGQNGCGRSL